MYKPLFQGAYTAWAILLEAIERHAIPDGLRDLLSSALGRQLLKKDEDGRYSTKSKTRVIGMCESLLRDAGRERASGAARSIGPR